MNFKVLTFLIAIFTAAASFGDYLFWEVDTAQVAEKSIGDWDTASIKYKTEGSDTWSVLSSTAFLNDTSYTPDLGQMSSDIFGAALVAANLGDGSSAWSVYIELSNNGSVVGKSEVGEIKDLGAYIKNNIGMGNIADIQRWSGGTYTAVPEPTSALMLLMGAALLSLKRKKSA